MRICLFDIDGTLISTGGAGRRALEAALVSEFGIERLIADVSISGRTDRAIARDLFTLHGLEDSPHNWQRFRTAYLGHLHRGLASRPGWVLPGVGHLLARLAGQGDVALGLLTGNIQEGARLKLARYDLFHHFRFGGFGDHHLERDSVAREALAAARSHSNGHVAAERVVVIGDTPLDIRCARAIGARALAVATGVHSMAELAAERPDVLLNDLATPAPLWALWQ